VSRIVTYAHRYKRPPRKKAKATAATLGSRDANEPAMNERAMVDQNPAAAEDGLMSSTDMLFHIALESGRYNDPLCLAGHYGQIYSQNGEDGMIAETFRRIGTGSKFFVEVGIGDGHQNNTRLLLESGWRGVWIEANPDNARLATELFVDFPVTVIQAGVTPGNFDTLLATAGVPECFDLLSLDIDQNTSHAWRAMQRHRARPLRRI
jgi:hypothetical protein